MRALLAIIVVLALAPAAWAQGFDPICGLSGGQACSPDTPKPKPKKKHKKHKRHAKKHKKEYWLKFDLHLVGPADWSSYTLNPLYVRSHGEGKGKLKLKRKPKKGEATTITKASGRISLKHEYLGYSDDYVFQAMGGGSFTYYLSGQRFVENTWLKVVESNDPKCPVGRASYLAVHDSKGSLQESDPDSLEFNVCGTLYEYANWTDGHEYVTTHVTPFTR